MKASYSNLKQTKLYLKKDSLLFLFLCMLSFSKIHAQKFDLFSTITGEGKEMIQVGEHIYISGVFNSSINFGTTTLTTPSANVFNIYLAKYDTLGNFIWAQKGGNTTAPIPSSSNYIEDEPTDIAADDQGNIYLTGVFEGDSCHWGNLSLSDSLKGFNSKSGFLAKFNSTGKTLWLNRLGSKNFKYYAASSINIDFGKKYLFISGRYQLPLVYGASNTLIKTSPGVVDDQGVWVAKIDSAGNMIQNEVVVTLDTINRTRGNVFSSEIEVINDSSFILSLTLFPSNNTEIFSIGSTQTFSAQSLIGTLDAFVIAKFSSFTNCDWIVHSKNDFQIVPGVRVVADNSGVVYFTGNYGGDSLLVQNMKLKRGSNYIKPSFPLFYGKIDAAGNLQELNSFENIRNSAKIGMNNKSEIIFTGSFRDSIRVGGKVLTSNGGIDVYLINTDSAFTPNWYQVGGGAGNDFMEAISSNNTSSVFFFLRYNGLAQFGSRYIAGNGSFETSLFGKLSECTNAPPKITFIGDTSLCLGDSVQLYTQAEPFSLIQWRKNNANLFGENFRDLPVGDSGIYDVITNQSGCIDTSASVNVAVEPFIASSLTLPDTLCENEIITLGGGTPAGGVYFGIGVQDSIFIASIAGIGTTTINYTYNNVGCSDTTSQAVVILTAPKPQISGAQQVCAFDSTSSYSTASNSGASYSWSLSGGSITSGQSSNSILVDWGAAGQGIVSLSVINANGCDTTVIDSIDIVSPSIAATIVGADSACANSINYTYSVATPSLFYNWTVTGGRIISGIGSSSIAVKWNNTSQGYLAVQLFNSCGSNATFYDTVSVFTKPTPLLTGDSSLCPNSSGVSYSAASSGMVYNWKVDTGGTIVSGQNTSSIVVDWSSSAGLKSVKLIETNANGCADSVSKAVTILASDSSSISANICQGASYSFGGGNLSASGIYYDTLIASNGCDSIVILTLNVLSNSSSALSASICQGGTYTFKNNTLSTAGTYLDTMVSSNGCDSIITLNLSIQAQLNDTVLINKDTLVAAQIGATYQWLECDTVNNTFISINGATNRYFVPNNLDYYAVSIGLNACIDTSLCYQGSISVGGIKNSAEQSNFNIYPNPTNNYVTLKGSTKTTEILTLEIRSISGQLILNRMISPQGNQFNTRIDLSSYGKGIYFLRLIGREQTIIKKVVVK